MDRPKEAGNTQRSFSSRFDRAYNAAYSIATGFDQPHSTTAWTGHGVKSQTLGIQTYWRWSLARSKALPAGQPSGARPGVAPEDHHLCPL